MIISARQIKRGRRSYSAMIRIKNTKRLLSTAKSSFIHDYSILPTSIQYRLPSKEHPALSDSHSNIIRYILEMGDIEGFDWQKNLQMFQKYPMMTAKRLEKRTKRPSNVKMLSSDFIEDSLYNPSYGYFAKQATIFQHDKPIVYKELSGQDEFMQKWISAYDQYDQKMVPVLKQSKENHFQLTKPSLQLWHTPTELFQPYYGEALARYLLVNYKLNQYPYNDLTIYEIGGGNGTLMTNILDFIQRTQPEVYERTRYNIVEISSRLFDKQIKNKSKHSHKVHLINQSVLDWNKPVIEPCFVVALEVFDNLAHDVVRYDINTHQPYQGYVLIDENNDFKEVFSPELNPWTKHFLNLREQSKCTVSSLKNHPLNQHRLLQQLKNAFYPLRNNLSDPEFVPTRLLKLFEILKKYFPNHQLVSSDFSTFDNTVPGYCSPLVQTMHKDRMVNVDSYMVNQGYFDIMFPTNFDVMSELYRLVVGKLCNTSTHADFLSVWADTEVTTTKSGENPMLDLYSNASFLYS
ncbi:hypothetical protein KL910_001394 [Ogataea haglerorum]|nr:hypothetical protein KL945_003255 [Ogataea haglerorum]KAG7792013.1 hypothetical protein KL910_001394 [Ogataea haglerorum]